jgi:beta-lactamase regulating signal transducer with metallopeptidase domain
MNFHKLLNFLLVLITIVLSSLTTLKTATEISKLKLDGMISIIYYDPKYRAFSFLNNTSLALAVSSGLLLIMVFVGMVSNKYSNTKIYKILTGLLTAIVLVLSVLVVYFTSDTDIKDPEADTTIQPAGNISEPIGKNKPYYLMGLCAGIIGILSSGSIWLVGQLS